MHRSGVPLNLRLGPAAEMSGPKNDQRRMGIGSRQRCGFFNDNALSHGAAMAFYAATSLAPILLIVVAIAGWPSGTKPPSWLCRPKYRA